MSRESPHRHAASGTIPQPCGHQVSCVMASQVQGTPPPSFWVTQGALGSPEHLSSTQEAGVCVHTFLSNRRNHAPEELLRDARLPPPRPAPTPVAGGAGREHEPNTPGGSASLQRDEGQGHGAQDGSAHRGDPGSTSGIALPCLSRHLLCPTAQEPHTRSDHVTSDLEAPTTAVIRGTNKGELQKPHENVHSTVLPHQPTVTPPAGLVGLQCIELSHCHSMCQPSTPTYLHPA